MNFSDNEKGFGLVETIVGVTLFVIISFSVYVGYTKILQGIQILKVKNAAASLANEQIEIVRNLPYADIGIVDGLPPGKLPRMQTITRNGIDFNVLVSIRDIDDPFDGLIGQVPNDLSPADYKLVQFDISCENCAYQENLVFYSRVSPQNLETTSNNGALFIQVFDSNGQPITGADVHIENNQEPFSIKIDEVTNNQGMFQIVDAPPSIEGYEILVTKEGYSLEKTYTVGDPENPAPYVPHANVVSGEITQISFAIDKLSDLFLETKNPACTSVSYVDINIRGSKMIGYNTYKFNENLISNSLGKINLTDLEWDNYVFEIIDSDYELVGASELLPIDLIPNTFKKIDLIVAPKNPNSLLVQVKDAETSLPLSDAKVVISKDGNDQTLITSRGFIKQTDWSSGGNQELVGDETRYYTNDGNVSVASPAGDLHLLDISGEYISSGTLTSSIFDIGTTTNFHTISWGPIDQAPEVGIDSIKFQIATNLELTATSTWNFIGPNGTTDDYYSLSNQNISNSHDGDRYLRYKVYLQTEDTNFTPRLSEVFVTYAADCTPPGQVFFNNLSLDEYSLMVELEGYQSFYTENLIINKPWQMYEIVLNPNI